MEFEEAWPQYSCSGPSHAHNRNAIRFKRDLRDSLHTNNSRFSSSLWQSILGLTCFFAVFGFLAVVVAVSVTARLNSVATVLIVAVWLLPLAVAMYGAVWIWVWHVSGVARTAASAFNNTLPHIETPRLTLRLPAETDAVALESTIDDAMRAGNGWTKGQGRALITAVGGGHPTVGLLVIVLRSGAAVIGGATVQPVGDAKSTRSIGWWIGPKHRGTGYASEAVAALVDAIHDAGFNSVEIGTHESNVAVQRICEKIGATVADRRSERLPDGSTIPAIWYEHQRTAADRGEGSRPDCDTAQPPT